MTRRSGDTEIFSPRHRVMIPIQTLTMQTQSLDTQRLWRALEDVNDPEFPMSLIDMGLVYGITREEERVRLQVTFTAMGCPAMEMILDDIRARLLQEEGVEQVDIEIVWSPPWNKSRMTKNGQDIMRAWGIAV